MKYLNWEKHKEFVWAGAMISIWVKEWEREMHERRWQHVFCMLRSLHHVDWETKMRGLSYLGFIVWIIFFICFLFTLLSIRSTIYKTHRGINIKEMKTRHQLTSSSASSPSSSYCKTKAQTCIRPLEISDCSLYSRMCCFFPSHHHHHLQWPPQWNRGPPWARYAHGWSVRSQSLLLTLLRSPHPEHKQTIRYSSLTHGL